MADNRRIAKNAVMLYFRMALSMIVSLYTSRVVLRVLGVEDFGIYGVVGGVVALLDFLNASMSGATSRFITYELGKGNIERLKRIFSSSLIIHICIAVVVVLVAETLGLWLLSSKLVIPEDRMYAAHIVYQISVITAVVNITQVPYSACVMAHEKMDLYAYMEIFRVVLKLIIVFLLEYLLFDKLIVYAVLLFAVSILLAALYRLYCIKNFQESSFQFVIDREILKPMLSFSGWDLYGNLCGTFKHQGTTIIINLFYGPAVNAAASIANTVIGSLSSLSSSTSVAFRPQIVKKYAQGCYDEVRQLAQRAMSATSFLLSICAFPLIAEMHLVLYTWLGQVPEWSVSFTQLAIFNSLIGNINAVLLTPIHATGNVKNISLIGGSLYLFDIVMMYFLLKFVILPPYWVFVINLLIMVAITIVDSILLQKQIPQIKAITLWKKAIMPIIMCSLALFYVGHLITSLMDEGFLRFLVVGIVLGIISILFYFFVVFDKPLRETFINKFRKIIS